MKKNLYIRGQKTAPFSVRMNNGRSVFRSEKPRALARGASFRILIFLLVYGFCFYSRVYSEEGSYDKLKKEYEALLADRDNLLAQAKNLLQYKDKYFQWKDTIEELTAKNEQLTREIDGRVTQIEMLKQKIEELKDSQSPLIEERDNLKNSLEKLEIEYRILPETKTRISGLKKENVKLVKECNQLEKEVKRLTEKQLDSKAQIEIYRRQLNDAKKQYDESLEKNRVLEKKVAEIPKQFTELARENRVLIKQTALMHYNLGVFYTENKQYSRAVAEFEKAIELNPEDPYAYYNLGYIYAEYMVNRPKAIEQFRHFLRVTKTEDKDVDWVKKYILTWQTWEGKDPMQ